MIGRLGTLSVATALLATVAVAGGPDFARMQVQPYDPPTPAPAFALPDLQGKTVRLESLRSKVVLLYFWATW